MRQYGLFNNHLSTLSLQQDILIRLSLLMPGCRFVGKEKERNKWHHRSGREGHFNGLFPGGDHIHALMKAG